MASGDHEVRRLRSALARVTAGPGSTEARTDDIHRRLLEAAAPWGRRADDRITSLMRNVAGEAVTDLVHGEIGRILEEPGVTLADRDDRLLHLAALLGDLTWVAEGFRSGLAMDIAFARADARKANRAS